MSIEKQKKVANDVLAKIETLDPTAIVAGGAPRDWYMEKEASDIDVFFHFRNDLSTGRIEQILKNLGLPVFRTITGEGLPEIYKKNPKLRAVFDCVVDDVPVQLLLMVEPTFTSVIDHFPLNICKVWYKWGDISTTKDFNRCMKHKAIVKVSDLYANGDRYVQKIKDKFPEFSYFESYEKLAMMLLDN